MVCGLSGSVRPGLVNQSVCLLSFCLVGGGRERAGLGLGS